MQFYVTCRLETFKKIRVLSNLNVFTLKSIGSTNSIRKKHISFLQKVLKKFFFKCTGNYYGFLCNTINMVFSSRKISLAVFLSVKSVFFLSLLVSLFPVPQPMQTASGLGQT